MMPSRIRLYVPDALTPGGEVTISGDGAHYLRDVMRVAVGAALLLFNARDGEWRARVIAADRSAYRLHLEACARPQQAEPGPWLLFSPLKKSAQDVLVGKATELGVERLVPVLSRFTVAERVNLDRLRAHAREAAEQCGRLTLPAVDAARPLLEVIAAWTGERTLLMMDERRQGEPIADVLQEARGRWPAALIVGPEGGFAPDEVEAIAGRLFVRRVSLGPRILRAETAAIAALACWQAFAGDWRRPPAAVPAQQQV